VVPEKYSWGLWKCLWGLWILAIIRTSLTPYCFRTTIESFFSLGFLLQWYICSRLLVWSRLTMTAKKVVCWHLLEGVFHEQFLALCTFQNFERKDLKWHTLFMESVTALICERNKNRLTQQHWVKLVLRFHYFL
jgi:hypothetical protein